MAALSEQDLAAVHRAYMQDEKSAHGALTKADLRAAVDALDLFFDVNATAINNAIPQPARTALTTPQKSRLVRYVLQKRFG